VNTKEAIEWIEDLVNDYSEVEGNESIVDDFRKIIFLLQQGKKYRQMWEELFKDFAQSNPDEHFIPYEIRNTMMKIEEYIEQKYFPREREKDK